MSIFTRFLDEYATLLIYSLLTAAAGVVGLWLKRLCMGYIRRRAKRRIVRSGILAVGQVYASLGGEEKQAELLAAVTEMLEKKGLFLAEVEIKVLIEEELSRQRAEEAEKKRQKAV